METPPRLKIERTSSIEEEPRTLTFDQLRYAREAALYVLSTKTMEEAIEIFTEGLKPVLSKRDNMDSDDDAQMLDWVEVEHLNLPFLERDIISAPF
ncbi:uncharacterized protein [Elaeis guineensis]|uniref:uncharacterized protein n=1 Tax=Elaeis guineensis var. tenera TaxID=51953 RepID=UPI003C6D8844